VPGGGYFTRIFAKAVGPRGHVYAVVPAELVQKKSSMADPVKAIAAEPGYGDVTVLVQPTAGIAAPAKLDMAFTAQNYHDIYGFFGADNAEAFDKAVFAALKPGGVFIVIDHVAPAGSGGADATTLHRIDPETVKSQVEAAGFRLEAQSPLLANPADDHQVKVFDPAIRGHTDQFVFKFRKPAA
jgi:predicted methyltransferase